MLNGLTPEELQLAEFDKEHGYNDFFYFARRILKYDLEEQPHREACRHVDDQNKRGRVYFGPRGCFKTSLISQAYPTYRIIRNSNIRILLDSTAVGNSERNVQVVERHLEHNQRLRFLFGDHSGKKIKWNDHEFKVCTRTDNNLKESTVTASGIGKIEIGTHYDLIIPDDLHDKENCKTAEQVAKVKEHLKLLLGLLDPKGEILIGGTRWGYNDAYTMVIGETQDEDELRFHEFFKNGIMIRGAEYPDGRLYFPARLTREHLARQRGFGRDIYAAQMMNEPIMTGENQSFPPRYFKQFKEIPEPVNWFMTVDPGGEKKKSDEWVFFESAVDVKSNKYFERFKKKVCKLTEAAEIIYARWKVRKFRRIGFEVSGQQGVILTAIKEYLLAKYNAILPFKELVHSTDSKAERIEAMAPEYEMGKIYHSPQMAEPFGLEDQLLKFPKGKDDVADAAAMVKEVARAPVQEQREEPPRTLDEKILRGENERLNAPIHRRHPIIGGDL